MLEPSVEAQLRTYLSSLEHRLELVTSLDDSAQAHEIDGMLREIAALGPRLAVVPGDSVGQRQPSFGVRRAGGDMAVRFAALPQGAQFTSLVLALLQIGGYPVNMAQALQDQVAGLKGDYVFETYISFSCHNCADVVQIFNAMSAINPRIKSVVIDGNLFSEEVAARDVQGVPMTFLNGQRFDAGRTSVEEVLARLAALPGAVSM